ncbi:MAG: NAD-dependent epimerase/dehydratase family protein, partial [Acidimicrobiales bacterium]
MRALVAGGAGFLGSHLVDRLLAEGHAVDVVDDLSTGNLANLADARADPGRQLRFHQLDMRTGDLDALLRRREVDVAYHLAAAPVGADPAATVEVTLLGGLHLLEAASGGSIGKVVVALGAAALYADTGPRQLPVRESHALEPRTVAGVAARAVLDALHLYRERHAVEHTALALGEVYGPRGAPAGGLVAAICAGLVGGGPCPVPGDGRQTSDHLYVDDAVDALARAAGRGGGLLLNVGTGQETSANAVYGLLAAGAGVD